MRIFRIPLMLAMATAMLFSSGSAATATSTSQAAQVFGCVEEYDDAVFYSNAAGAYVSAEFGYTGNNYGMLRARAGYPNAWEKFRLCKVNTGNPWDGIYAIESQANSMYVTAEIMNGEPDKGMLRASEWVIQGWELFHINSIGGQYITIQSLENHLYVSSELGYGGYRQNMLRARASAVGYWEYFELGSNINAELL